MCNSDLWPLEITVWNSGFDLVLCSTAGKRVNREQAFQKGIALNNCTNGSKSERETTYVMKLKPAATAP